MMLKKKEKTNRELRIFGIIMATAFAAITAYLFWKDTTAWIYLASISGLFLLSGLIYPNLLSPIERIWMKMAYYLGSVITFALLTLTFYLIITPLGLFLSLIRKDLLALRFDRSRKSYWIAVDPEGPSSRPDKPY